jgi:hypothetical protein
MMKMRVLHKDGRDEVYNDVIKVTTAHNEYGSVMIHIFTDKSTFEIREHDTLFIQYWDESKA